MGAYMSLERNMGIDDNALRKRYDKFAKQNEKGFVSFDKYKETAENLSNGNAVKAYTHQEERKYYLPPQYETTGQDDEGNEITKQVYTDEEYAKMKTERNNKFFVDLDAAADAEAAKGLSGAAGQKKALGAGNGGEEEGYSERLRGNIRKAIGRNKQ